MLEPQAGTCQRPWGGQLGVPGQASPHLLKMVLLGFGALCLNSLQQHPPQRTREAEENACGARILPVCSDPRSPAHR